MIADAMAMCLMYPLPGDDTEPRRMELREPGKANIAELAAECERNGWKHEVCQVEPQLISSFMRTHFVIASVAWQSRRCSNGRSGKTLSAAAATAGTRFHRPPTASVE